MGHKGKNLAGCDYNSSQFLLVSSMAVCSDANERDAVCLRLVNSRETWPFSSCGHAVARRLMFKEKGGAALGREAFYRDAARLKVECCGIWPTKKPRPKKRESYCTKYTTIDKDMTEKRS